MSDRVSDAFKNVVFQRAAAGEKDAIDLLMTMGPAGEEARMADLLAQHLLRSPQNLSDDVRAILISKIAPRGADALEPAQAQTVYNLISGVDLEKHLAKIDQTLKSYLYPSLAASDFFNRALQNWDQWSVDEKIKYGRDFAQSFRRISGSALVTMQADVIPQEMAPQDGLGASMGMCIEDAQTGRCTIKMNTYENVAFKTQKDFDETLYHELMHTVQKRLAQLARQGNLTDVPQEFRTSAILLAVMNTRMFYMMVRNDPDAYAAFPMEAHAENNARDFGTKLHDPVTRENLLAAHKMLQIRAGGVITGKPRVFPG